MQPALIATTRDQGNVAALDSWSLVHFGTGVLWGLLGWNAWLFVFGHVAYEVGELIHESPSGSKIFGSKRPESDLNMVSDLSVAFAGVVAGALLRSRT